MIKTVEQDPLTLALENVTIAMELCDQVGERLAVCHLQLGADLLLAAIATREAGAARPISDKS